MQSGAGLRERLILLDSERATLANAGGKGANLARLTRAGFPVPPGFIITTHAFDSFVSSSGIAALIEAELKALKAPAAHASPRLEELSERITRLFTRHPLDEQLAIEILSAYRALGGGAVAVRSSATTEDLPDLSFAGQQATFLNVVGENRLLQAIVDCWVSLWAPRAIEYRERNRVPVGAIAVVVQRMVESDTSGVLFTAHPVTGNRSQTVIEATWGLGEALVSGRVEPDSFTVDSDSLQIVQRSIGAKQHSIRGSRDGGVESRPDPRCGSDAASIDDEQIRSLVTLSGRVLSLFGIPQDIEWALSDGKLYLLQSRAITSLFPLPAGMPSRPLQVMFSFAAIQGVMDPFTPLGCDMIRQIFASASHIFGYRYDRESQRTIATAGGRLWVNMTSLLRNQLGRKAVRKGLAFIEPTVMQALDTVWDDSQIGPVRTGMPFKTVIRILRFVGPIAGNIVMNMVAPRRRRERLVRRAEGILARVRRQSARGDTPLFRLTETAASVGRAFDTLIPPTLVRLVAGVATGMASLHLLNMTARRCGAAVQTGNNLMADLVLEATRGTPNNPTTEMDLALWNIAKTWLQLEGQPDLDRPTGPRQSADDRLSARRIYDLYEAGTLPSAVQKSVADFLERYGARGLAELDIGRPRWRDEPLQLFEILDGYLEIRDSQAAPDVVFARSTERASEAIEQMAAAARASASGLRGAARAARIRFAVKRARAFVGFREYPKFFAVRMMDVFRTNLMAIGGELAHAGLLAQAEDLFYLTLSEQEELGEGRLAPEIARSLVDARRIDYRRELLRRRIPRLLLSDGRAFYDGIDAGPPDAAADGQGNGALRRLTGSPVSPGTVEARARVVQDPRQSRLEPGEIMVCRGTDPSWTPLFLIAGGLIMEVGGMMTHGAVVAREYGIPAVVGVHEATRRIATGAQVRLDGSSGLIELSGVQE